MVRGWPCRLGQCSGMTPDLRCASERDPDAGGGRGRRISGTATDDVLDPDSAVKELESMAYLLGQLEESEKRQIVAFAEAEAGRASSDEYRAFLRQFPQAMGL